MRSNSAILIFSRLPQEEISHKRISPNTGADLAVWQHFYDRTFKAAKKTGLPIITCSEKEQLGNDFAEKITNAIALAFESGYQKLIVLGADCAQLNHQHIAIANNKLQQGADVVAGRDMRGGIYLLAIDKAAFDSEAFLTFGWQTNKLFTDIVSYSAEFCFTTLSAVLKDINTGKDVSAIVHFISARSALKLLLIKLLETTASKRHVFSENISASIFTRHRILRGPPALF